MSLLHSRPYLHITLSLGTSVSFCLFSIPLTSYFRLSFPFLFTQTSFSHLHSFSFFSLPSSPPPICLSFFPSLLFIILLLPFSQHLPFLLNLLYLLLSPPAHPEPPPTTSCQLPPPLFQSLHSFHMFPQFPRFSTCTSSPPPPSIYFLLPLSLI